LKKPAAGKRADPPRRVDFARAFFKDWERLTRTGRYDMARLKAVMLMLIANDAPLGAEWKDHPLKGEWTGHRECHVGGDFLLIYLVDANAGPAGAVVFVRAGTHSELFNE
jgi:mRNA interferase YafQ